MPADGSAQPRPDFFHDACVIVAGQVAARAAHPPAGVCWSALTAPPPEIETVETVAARLQRRADDLEAFRASPEGRFYRAALLIAEATGDDRLLSCHSRGLATNMDRARKLLTEAQGPAAEDAFLALEEIEAGVSA